MRRIVLLLAIAMISIASYAQPGDVTPIQASQIYEVRQEQTVSTETGKTRTEIIVIYFDNAGRKRLAYMTKSDYRKYEQAQLYGLYVEYELVEMKGSKMKLVIK